MQKKVCGIGHSLVDIQAQVTDDTFASLAIPKGSAELIEETKQIELLRRLLVNNIETCLSGGGSVANSLVTLAKLGVSAAFTSRIGGDTQGATLKDEFSEIGLKFSSNNTTCSRTGTVVVVTTPDGERTMRAHLGASTELDNSDIDSDLIKSADIVFLEGYLVANGKHSLDALIHATKIAKANGKLVALTLGSHSVVKAHLQEFNQLINEIDILLGNEKEACALTDAPNALSALWCLTKHIPIIAVTCGARGALVAQNGEIAHAAPFPTKVVDTTGAGDAFAAGFIYGILNNCDAEKAASYGNFLAAKVVSIKGPRIEAEALEEFKEYTFNNTLPRFSPQNLETFTA